jgi:PKD repeat protein
VAQEGRLPKAPEEMIKTPIKAVSEPACVAIITPDTDEGPAPLSVTFSAEGLCTDADGEFVWDFGDGSPAAKGTTASHTYEKPGEYTAKVTLADPIHNVSDEDEILITVTTP